MFRILESQAPAKQTATDTIATLSGRLQSATLLEDRRAAILGLRSFAKPYPASVASGALRNLINSLTSDSEDADTIKVVLDTLLMLFNPDQDSPEASDDIALWLADEFTQRQENITVLLDLLDRPDFFCRLYSLQLINAISSARPERTQECVYVAPLGVSRLVAVLEDKREAVRAGELLLSQKAELLHAQTAKTNVCADRVSVRQEGLAVLVAVTPAAPELQKLVAFENAFDRIFAIIEAEGSLTHGGVLVQDSLSLLANLVRLNSSNQSFFRETGGVGKIGHILQQVLKEESDPEGVPEWAVPQRDKNLWGFLAVIRLFLIGHSAGTLANQASFWQNSVTFQILDIAFHQTLSIPLRSEALLTCGDLIRGNKKIQERFAQREVAFSIERSHPPTPSPGPQVNGTAKDVKTVKVNVIQGLLDLSLAVSIPHPFDVRWAACECLKAYFRHHGPIRHHFLSRACEGHLSSDVEPDNILTILLETPGQRRITDPYRHWVAAVLLFHLIHDDYEAKNMAMSISEGDAGQGEEVVTCIQGLSSNLVALAQAGEDERITIGYLMVLSSWLYENPDAVNDFLQEGANVQNLVQIVMQASQSRTLEAGLCAFLLGIIYEFSTKDSPVTRATLHEILTTRLGREQFADRLTRLREHPLVRDFEVLPQGLSGAGRPGDGLSPALLPDVYFDRTFVEFLKDHFSRVFRSIDRDPGLEVAVEVAQGVTKGISREMVDSLRAQLEDRTAALQRAEASLLTLERQLGQEGADHRRERDTLSRDLAKATSSAETERKEMTEAIVRLREEHRLALSAAEKAHVEERDRLQNERTTEVDQLRKSHDEEATRVRSGHSSEVQRLRDEKTRAEQQSREDYEQKLQQLRDEHSSAISEATRAVEKAVTRHQTEARRLQADHEALSAKQSSELTSVRSELSTAQSDLQKAADQHALDVKKAQDDFERQRQSLEDRLQRAQEESRLGEESAREDGRKGAQSELDDLLMVLGDLEEKRARDKKRLKELGENVSEGEEDADEENDEDDKA